MISHVIGDILEYPGITGIMHQCNCYCTMGSGLALQIKNRYRAGYIADEKTKKGDLSKLGTFSYGITLDGKIIYNLYSQAGYGSRDRQTSYDAMDVGLRAIREDLRIASTHRKINVGIPYKLGCGLANGNWKIVLAIIDSIFEDEEYSVTICRRPSD